MVLASAGPTGPLLPEQQIRAALARTARDWMEIYVEVIMETVRQIVEQQPSLEGKVMEDFRGSTRPRLRRIAREFDAAGFALTDDLEIQGAHPGPGGQPLWEDSTNPVVVFSTPDGRQLIFAGEDAPSALGFMQFWLQHAPLVKQQEQKSRIINPGDPGYDEYFRAKAKSQRGE